MEIQKAIHSIAKVVQGEIDFLMKTTFFGKSLDVLKDVEVQEPRFISTLNENNGRYEGV